MDIGLSGSPEDGYLTFRLPVAWISDLPAPREMCSKTGQIQRAELSVTGLRELPKGKELPELVLSKMTKAVNNRKQVFKYRPNSESRSECLAPWWLDI